MQLLRVQPIVYHFKDKVEYYEVLNEPETPLPGSWVEVPDYVNLVKRTVAVIREEYPEAKIVAAATSDLEYLFGVLQSDVMPLVDAVSWHPIYGQSPEYKPEYYYSYPSIIQEIKDVAWSHGFRGEFIADELSWRTPLNPISDQPMYNEIVCAKYHARGIVLHLGMNVSVSLGITSSLPVCYTTIQNLCTIMSGAEPISLPIEIQSEATNIMNYSFSLSNGDNLIALWTDGVAEIEDLGVKANLTIYGFTAQDVIGIDVLNGFEQPIIISNENGNLVIQNLIVKDYPLMLHIIKPG